MNKQKIVIVLLVFLSLCFGDEVYYVENQLIVKFQPELKEADLTQLFRNTGYTVEKILVKRMNLWLVSTDPSRTGSLVNALEVMKEKPEVIFAQFDHVVTQREFRNEPNDPDFDQMWDMHNTGQSGGMVDADIDAPEAWDITTGGITALGDEIVVAVVDGGVQTSHEDLAANIWVNQNEIAGNGVDDDNNGYVDDIYGWDAYSNDGSIPSDAHGTHVAGTMGAVGDNGTDVVGVNWNVKIMCVAGASGTTSTISIAYGYILDQKSLWLETNGQYGANVVATNSSFGVDYADCNSGSYPVWNDLYNSMGEVGILSAAATINANVNVDQQGDVPTGCDSDWLIAVTNTTRNDVKYGSAGYGTEMIDLGAPGTDICSTVPTNGVSCSYTGTSMATPHVAGAVGFLHAAASASLAQICLDDPGQGALMIKQAILDNVDPLPSLDGITVSGGRLNLYNSAFAISGPAPELQYSPGSFDVSFDTDETITEFLTISNVGEVDSELHFSISISPFTYTGGGPDAEGNYWADSDNESTITAEWIDITEIGMLYNFPHNDQAGDPIDIGFDFSFYGQTYSQYIVNANGWVGFGSDNTEWDNSSIPNPSAPRPAIFGFWDDLNPVNDLCNEFCAGEVYTHSNSDRTVISFNQVAHWWTNFENSFYDFQVVLFPSGIVQLNYGTIIGIHAATIGMQDESGSVGLQVSYNNDFVHENLSVRFAQEPTWVFVSPDEGDVSEGNSTTVDVTCNSSGLSEGVYTANIKITSNGGSASIPVTLTVGSSGQTSMELSYFEGWNLVGLPLEVDESSYNFLFPESIDETLYSFDNGYNPATDLIPGEGYWLRFPDAGSSTVTGSSINELTISLNADWNLVAGLSEDISIYSASDPDGIIVQNTLYGFSDGYFITETLVPGKGFWLRAFQEGEITLSSGDLAKVESKDYSLTEKANTLSINGADLFFGVEMSPRERLSYSLPPKPLTPAFDVRFKDGWRVVKDYGEIKVMNTNATLTISFDIKVEAGKNQNWVLTSEIGENYIFYETGEITIPTSEKFILTKKPILPTQFTLHHNFPNPFNPITTLRYDLPTDAFVTLTVFDMLGREITKLVNTNQEAGFKSVKWDAKDNFGKPVSAGVYLYQIQTGDFTQTRKMILLK